MVYKPDFSNLVTLAADNFTQLSRTPWAGREIAKSYKGDLLGIPEGKRIGESWEFSCEPSFPSRVVDESTYLHELFAEHKAAIIGNAAMERGVDNCEILVKLLNADQNLSVQVHPRDGDSFLKPNECGKPETWLVLKAAPGAGIYIGFSKPISISDFKVALQGGRDIRSMLHFVEVRVNDYFEIEPGVTHAIAPGTVLLEPQRVSAGKEGKTYRLWDWNRKYNEKGEEDSTGKPRPLHVEESIRLIDTQTQVGDDFVRNVRRKPKTLDIKGGGRALIFPKNDYYQVIRLDVPKGGRFKLDLSCGYGSLTVLRGKARFKNKTNQSVSIRGGQTALVPNAALPLQVSVEEDMEAALVIPAVSDCSLNREQDSLEK